AISLPGGLVVSIVRYRRASSIVSSPSAPQSLIALPPRGSSLRYRRAPIEPCGNRGPSAAWCARRRGCHSPAGAPAPASADPGSARASPRASRARPLGELPSVRRRAVVEKSLGLQLVAGQRSGLLDHDADADADDRLDDRLGVSAEIGVAVLVDVRPRLGFHGDEIIGGVAIDVQLVVLGEARDPVQ